MVSADTSWIKPKMVRQGKARDCLISQQPRLCPRVASACPRLANTLIHRKRGQLALRPQLATQIDTPGSKIGYCTAAFLLLVPSPMPVTSTRRIYIAQQFTRFGFGEHVDENAPFYSPNFLTQELTTTEVQAVLTIVPLS